MPLRICTDVSPAAWLVRSQVSPNRLVSFGPDGFEAYARLRYIPDPTYPGQSEGDGVPDDHPSDISTAQRALRVLARFTTTPDEGYFCRWDGYGDLGLPPGCALVTLPNRRYALLAGGLAAIDEWDADSGEDGPPAFVWPGDHAWCFASDVDPHWAGIGASKPAIDALLDDPALDVVQVRSFDTMPTYY